MYVPSEDQRVIADHLVDLFFGKNMVAFTKRANNLYEEYGEYTADDIMLKVRNGIIQRSKNKSYE